MKYLLKIQV